MVQLSYSMVQLSFSTIKCTFFCINITINVMRLHNRRDHITVFYIAVEAVSQNVANMHVTFFLPLPIYRFHSLLCLENSVQR